MTTKCLLPFFFLGLLTLQGCSATGSSERPRTQILRQDPVRIDRVALANKEGAPVTVVISLSKQRAYLMVGNRVAVDTPISTGVHPGWTPVGTFCILQKIRDHRSNLYGSIVTDSGQLVRGGVNSRKISIPRGHRFQGAPMKYFMRIDWGGVGMHVGHLPGYPASKGCIRMPEEGAEAIFHAVDLKTPVIVRE